MEQQSAESAKKKLTLPINTKSMARIVAIQTIYTKLHAADYDGLGNIPYSAYEEIYHMYTSDLLQEVEGIKVRLNVKSLESISQSVANHAQIIAETVIKVRQNAPNLVLESILCCAIAERIADKELAYQILAKEYTDIASELLNPKEIGFINVFLQQTLPNFLLK